MPANVYEKDDKIWIAKKCYFHGVMESVVETDTVFYHDMNYVNDCDGINRAKGVLYEITDKCNLNCPHCYHLPDNNRPDEGFEEILTKTSMIPTNCTPIFAGAEPTMRKDFIKVVESVAQNYHCNLVLSNGIKFADERFTKDVKRAGLSGVIFGLNHWSYQGKSVHNKQLTSIENIIAHNLILPYVGYTIESLDHLAEIFDEIDEIDNPRISQYRIRCGSFIGRSSDRKRNYVSDTVKKIKEILGDDIITDPHADNNIYHYNMIWKGRKIRVIQWPDVNNINMEELNCDPYCYFYDGPITNFVHQVITRDAYINMGIAPQDRVPEKYVLQNGKMPYWRDNWKGITEIDDFDWTYDSKDMHPRGINNEPRQRIIRAISE